MDPRKRPAAAKNPNDRTRLQSQIDATDREIDRLVYDLYGLTEEEIKSIEGCGEPRSSGASVASSFTMEEN